MKMKVMNYFKVPEPSDKRNTSYWYKRLKLSILSKVISQTLLIKWCCVHIKRDDEPQLLLFTALSVKCTIIYRYSPHSSAIDELIAVYPTIVWNCHSTNHNVL